MFLNLSQKIPKTKKKNQTPQNLRILASSKNWLCKFRELVLVKTNYVLAFQIFPTQLCRSQSSDHQRND